MRSRVFAVIALLALLAASASAAADAADHWRATASKGAVYQYDQAKAKVNGLALPDTAAVAAQAEAAAQAVTSLDPQAFLDSLGDPLAPVQGVVDSLQLPGLPDVGGAAGFAVRVVQYQASNAVRLFTHLRP